MLNHPHSVVVKAHGCVVLRFRFQLRGRGPGGTRNPVTSSSAISYRSGGGSDLSTKMALGLNVTVRRVRQVREVRKIRQVRRFEPHEPTNLRTDEPTNLTNRRTLSYCPIAPRPRRTSVTNPRTRSSRAGRTARLQRNSPGGTASSARRRCRPATLRRPASPRCCSESCSGE